MDNRLGYNAVLTAVKVAECAGFKRASDVLQIPASTISARVQALERTLGVKLLHRSTRRIRLTEAGQIFFEHARRGSEAFEEAVTAATQFARRPRGLLRIITPTLFARHVLPQLLPNFLAKYPELILKIDTMNALPDLVEHGADIGIGVGASQRAMYTRRSLFWFSEAVYASPSFVARWGNLTKPAELQRIPVLNLKASSATLSWVLVKDSRRLQVELQPRVRVDDVSAMHALTLAGIGAALLPEQLCKDDVATGKLVRLLPGWSTQRVQVSAYYPRRRLEPEKVEVFLDHLVEWFARQES